jgi:hypothetical protein
MSSLSPELLRIFLPLLGKCSPMATLSQAYHAKRQLFLQYFL